MLKKILGEIGARISGLIASKFTGKLTITINFSQGGMSDRIIVDISEHINLQ